MGGKLWPDIGVGLTALPPLREMAARPQYGANAASVAMRGEYLPGGGARLCSGAPGRRGCSSRPPGIGF